MDSIVDANILFAIMIKRGMTERILFADELRPYAPEYIFEEFREHEKEILRKTKRTKLDFLKLLDILERRIELIPDLEFKDYFKEANKLLSDKDDAAYLAVCLAKQMSLWSNDTHFKQQNKVKVFTTLELMKFLRIDEKI